MRRLFFGLFIFVMLAGGCVHSKNIQSCDYLISLPVHSIQVGDVDLAYRELGKGEPLLLIMGFAGTMDIWDTVFVRELAAKYTVIIYDNRGVGGSTAGDKQVTISQMAADSAGLLDVLGYSKAHVLGWSMGGMIAQELALNNPEKVDKLILMGTACDPRPVADITNRLMSMNTKELLSHFFPESWLAKHPDIFTRLPRPAAPVSSEIIKAQAEAMINWSGTCERLYELKKDTLIISGTDDDILPGQLSLELATRIEGSWLARYKNAAHWLMYQDPKSLSRTVSTFLEVNENTLN